MISVKIFEDVAGGGFEQHSTNALLPFLLSRYGASFPANARIYRGSVSHAHDVTPRTTGDVTRLADMTGEFCIVHYPKGDPLSWAVAIVITVLAVGAAFLLKPKTPSIAPNSAQRAARSTSPNNELAERTNQARPGGRIPDIFGTVRATPDLIVKPYAEFVDNREVEHTVLCLGRGYHEIHDAREDTTDCRYIPDMSVEFYHPHTDIVSGDPYFRVGPPIEDLPMLSIRSNSVNGQKLEAPNARNYAGSGNVVFSASGSISLSSGAANLLSDRFKAGDDIAVSNSASGDNDINLDGTYRMVSVTNNTIWLDNPAAVNGNWTNISGSTDGTSAYLASTGEGWIGWFFLADEDRTEIWANIVAMNGIYRVDDEGNQYALSVSTVMQVRPADRAGNPIGEIEEYPLTLSGSSVERSTVAATLKAVTSFTGPCLVRERRTSYTSSGGANPPVDEVQWRDLYAMAPLPVTDFGNATMIRLSSVATSGALVLKERKLNCLVTRQLQLHLGDGEFTTEYYSTNSVADILPAAMMDLYIGRMSVEEIDFENIESVAAEIEEYFGDSRCSEFCYTFDSKDTEGGETASMIAGAAFCTPYRQGRMLRLFFEREEELSSLLFNHRNKIPGSETRKISFGLSNDNDSVEYQYVSPEDDALVTIRMPESGGINPREIESVGVRNGLQAYFALQRAWNRMQYQRLAAEFEATPEADILIPGMRVLVADNVFDRVIDGQVEHQEGLEVFTSQTLHLEAEYTDSWGLTKPKPYQCFLQLADGSVQAMTVTKGSKHNSFLLREPPRLPLVFDDGAYAKTVFYIAENEDEIPPMAMLVETKEGQDNGAISLECVNYDRRYYANDKDFIEGYVTAEGVRL